MVHIYTEEHKGAEAVRLVSLAKSDSGCRGAELRSVHMRLGELMGAELEKAVGTGDTVIIVMLTGAVPLAFGVGTVLDTKMLFYDPHNADPFPDVAEANVVIVDEVINSGESVREIAEHYATGHSVTLVTTVMPDDSEAFRFPYEIYTFRVSNHRYVGAMTKKRSGNTGPDTSARLYARI